jgi:hypothetical protein
MHPFTGPWRIVKSLPGATYDLDLSGNSTCWEKKHASNLSPYLAYLIPFQPVDGPDNWYGQLYKIIGSLPYKEAGIKGFTPSKPFVVAVNFPSGDFQDVHFPTLSKLNYKFDPFPWSKDKEQQ